MKKNSEFFELCSNMNFIFSNYNSNLEQIHFPRYESLSKRFQKYFNEPVKFIFRCGGLVTLMGENLSYFGYSPMYLSSEQEILFAFSFDSSFDFFEVKHFESGYENLKFNKKPYDKFKDQKDSFYNYVLAGYKAALIDRDDKNLIGIKLLIGGNIPKNCNLGSSTALILGVCALTMFVNAIKLTKEEIFVRICKYEKMISTNFKEWQVQALIEIQRNKVLYGNKLLEVPEQFSFILAESLAQNPRLMTRGTRFFKRLCEVRICLAVVLAGLELENKIGQIKSFAELQKFLDYNIEDMIEIVKTHVEDKDYITTNLEKLLGKTLVDIIGDIPNFQSVLNANFSFCLQKRGLYVLQENKLCYEVAQILEKENIKPFEKIQKIVDYFELSDKNSLDYFDNQSQEIISLKASFKKLGAKAVKMTGEGWGGCVFAIVDEQKNNAISEELIKDFYLNKENKLLLWDDIKMYICQNYSPIPPALAGINPKYEIWF